MNYIHYVAKKMLTIFLKINISIEFIRFILNKGLHQVFR